MKRVVKLLKLLWYYFVDLLKSNLMVTRDVITPGELGEPAVLKLKTRCTNDVQVFVLACFIAMTPGSLCIKVSKDRRYIWVHHLYPQKTEGLIDIIKNKYEANIVEIF